MKKFILAITIFLTCQVAYSAQWYNDIGKELKRIEVEQNGVIWVMRPSSDSGLINLQGCDLNQAKLVPPPGKEEAWLSMVLAAKFAKTSINIYGDCDLNNKRINGTRLTVE